MRWLLLALALLALFLAAAWILREEPGPDGLRAPAAVPANRSEDAELRDVDALATPAGEPAARSTRAEAHAAPAVRAALTVHVLDRDDDSHLAGIEVWRSDAPVRRRRGSGLWRADPSGPSGGDERLRHGLSSPFVLELGDDTPAALWIAADGYLPFRFVRPARPADGELWVHLERASGLELRLAGAPVDPKLARVRLYGPTPAAAEPAGDWREERPAERALRFAALEPGTWCATVEQRVGDRGRWAILAQARAELARGEWRTLALDVLDPQQAFEPAILTLRFPPAWLEEPDASARLVAGPGNSGRLGEGHGLVLQDAEPIWGPLGLVPGRYTLVLEPGNIEFQVELAPGERRELDVPEVRLCDVAIRLLDGDGAPLALEWVSWRTALDWDGRPSERFLSPYRVEPPDDPLRLRVAAAPLELMVFESLSGSPRPTFRRRVVVEPCGAGELQVRVPAPTRLELALVGLDDELDLDWLLRVRLTLDGATVEPAERGVVDAGEESVANLMLERAGLLALEFPPLPSHGSLRPRSVLLREGESVRLTLGPADLASAARERR